MSRMMTDQEYLDEFYFWKQSKGEIPKLTIKKADGSEVVSLAKLSYSETAEYIDFVLYPAIKKLSFESAERLTLGDEIEFTLSYAGQSADGLRYHQHEDTPFKHKMMINKVTTAPLGVYGGGTFKYQAGLEFVGLTNEKVTLQNGKNVAKHLEPLYTISTMDDELKEFAVKRIKDEKLDLRAFLRALASYYSFVNREDQAGFGVISVRDEHLGISKYNNKQHLYITPSTVAQQISYSENFNDVIQSGYWDEGDIKIDVKEGLSANELTRAIKILGSRHKYINKPVNAKVARQDKYFNLGRGRVKRVFNPFVKDEEIQDFLDWKIQQHGRKSTYQMATNFFSKEVGSVAKVYLDDNAQYGGNIIGKKINYHLGDNLSYNLTFDIMRNHDWTKPTSVDGQDFDTGATWSDV